MSDIVITLDVDGEKEEYRFEEGTPTEEIMEFADSRMGVDPDTPTEVNHPDLEFADVLMTEHPETKGLRTICRIDGCDETEVFDTLDDIKDSEWTELGMPKGFLTDMTDLHYAYCPHHSLNEDEGYDPQKDMGSPNFDNRAPNAVKQGLDE